MPNYDFDRTEKRIGTDSIKWDYASSDGVLRRRTEAEDPLVSGALIPMWLADMDFAPAEPIVKALTDRARGVLGYTRPGEEYFDAIRSWVGSRHGWEIERDWILPTVGTLPLINIAVQSFTEPGDGIIVQPPVFYPIPNGVENNGRIAMRNPLLYRNGRYEIDFDDFEAKAADPRCKMIILCSPHNPVGRVWTTEELQRIGDICRRHDLLIVSDELHADLTYSWARFNSIGAVDADLHDRIIVAGGPSKAFNVPGLKAAYCIVPDPELRAAITGALQRLDLLFSVDALSTLALKTAYREGADWLAQMTAYLEGNVEYLKQFVASELPQVRLVHPDALYLMWLDFAGLGMNGDELRQLFVDKAGVYVEIGNSYGAEGDGFVRLNIGCSRQLLKTALERLKSALDAKRSG